MPVGACLSGALLAPCEGGRQPKPSELPWEAYGQVGPGLEVSLASCLSLLSQALCDRTYLLPTLFTPGCPRLQPVSSPVPQILRCPSLERHSVPLAVQICPLGPSLSPTAQSP